MNHYTTQFQLVFYTKKELPYFADKWLSFYNYYIIIPKGYSWNGYFSDHPFLVLNALYQYAGMHHMTRHMVDLMFLEQMYCYKFKLAKLFYVGVRLFGLYAWQRCVKENEARKHS